MKVYVRIASFLISRLIASDVSSQPVLADEVQTFKALITIHKVLQEGHPIVIREAQQHANWIDSLMRGVGGDGIRGMLRLPCVLKGESCARLG
jgi:hypothetical protein